MLLGEGGEGTDGRRRVGGPDGTCDGVGQVGGHETGRQGGDDVGDSRGNGVCQEVRRDPQGGKEGGGLRPRASRHGRKDEGGERQGHRGADPGVHSESDGEQGTSSVRDAKGGDEGPESPERSGSGAYGVRRNGLAKDGGGDGEELEDVRGGVALEKTEMDGGDREGTPGVVGERRVCKGGDTVGGEFLVRDEVRGGPCDDDGYKVDDGAGELECVLGDVGRKGRDGDKGLEAARRRLPDGCRGAGCTSSQGSGRGQTTREWRTRRQGM